MKSFRGSLMKTLGGLFGEGSIRLGEGLLAWGCVLAALTGPIAVFTNRNGGAEAPLTNPGYSGLVVVRPESVGPSEVDAVGNAAPLTSTLPQHVLGPGGTTMVRRSMVLDLQEFENDAGLPPAVIIQIFYSTPRRDDAAAGDTD